MAVARAGSWAFHPQLDRSSLQGGFTRQNIPKVKAQRWPIPIKHGDGVEPFKEGDTARARYLTVAEAKRLVDDPAPTAGSGVVTGLHFVCSGGPMRIAIP